MESSIRAAGYALAALIGLLLGSFFTATASRVLYYFYGPGRKAPQRWTLFLTRPSFCDTCEHRLSPLDLVPLLGFLIARGRCRYCGARIGLATLGGEALLGALLPLLLASGHGWPVAFLLTIAVGQLYIAFATDLYFYLIDHENTALIALWALGALLASALGGPAPDWSQAQNHLFAAGGSGLVFLALYAVGRGRAMGFADVLLAAAIGLLVGFPLVLPVFTTASAGAIFYVFVIRRDRRAPAPFGSCMAAAAAGTMLLHAFWRAFQLPALSRYWFPYT